MKNEYSTREKEITDKGWEAMRQLLDREMPQDQRRPRALWWWLAGLLLLPALWLLFRMPSSRPEPVSPVQRPEAAAEAPIAARPAPEQSTAPEAGPTPEAAAPARSAATPPQRTTAQKSASAGSPASQPLTAPASPANRLPEPRAVTTTVAARRAPEAGQTPAMTQTGEPAVAAGSDHRVDPPSATPARPAALPSVKSLPVEPGAVASRRPERRPGITPPAPATASLAPPKVAPAPPALRLGGAAGLVASDGVRPTGYSAGLALDWQPARRWGVQTGLAYRLEQPEVEQRPRVEVSGIDYAAVTGDLSVLPDTPSNFVPSGTGLAAPDVGVTVPVQRLHRLEMPVLAFWQPIDKLRLYAGLNPSYLLSTQSSDRYLAPDQSVLQQDDQNTTREVSQLATSQLPRWQWAGQLGASFRLDRRAEVGLFYRQTWVGETTADILSSETLSDPLDSNPASATRPAPVFSLKATVFF